MKLLLLGAQGQLGRELSRTLASLGQVEALARDRVDFTDLNRLRSVVQDADPGIIVNAAAYTHVDRAETEPDLAFRINGDAPRVLAEEAARTRALLVHFSTDYVFDGKIDRPYAEDDPTSPLNVYGASKLAGDKAILETDIDALVFRISWVYDAHGRNFLNTIRRLASQRPELRVVSDQYGSPTWARSIAEATTAALARWQAAHRHERDSVSSGVYHMTASDHTTWYGFAQAIVDKLELPEGQARPAVTPIPTSDYPTPACRPRWSVLDSSKLRHTFGLELPMWREQLAMCVRSE